MAVAKLKQQFVCDACGVAASRWEGRCAACGAWNTLSQSAPPRVRVAAPSATARRGVLLHDVSVAAGESRLGTGLAEVDRVLGGGLLPASLTLLGGDPGIGKSTLALQIAAFVAASGDRAVYCSGEESAEQIALRGRRLALPAGGLEVLAETDLDTLAATLADVRPRVAVVDSVQTVADAAVPGSAGSVSQVRGAVARLLEVAKTAGVTILLVGHVTKDGAIAGPRTLEHMVDVVLYLEGDRHGETRLLRGVKNRFGATGELGLLGMDADGVHDLPGAARAFLGEATTGVPGTATTVTCDGLRPLAVEVQALTVRNGYGIPRRAASGFDAGRLQLLLAVLERRAGIATAQCDVYVNVAGGVRLSDPGADLAVALAIASAVRDRALPPGVVAVGELGLGGEVRRVSRLPQRLQEAAGLGLDRAVVAAGAPAAATRLARCTEVAALVPALEAVGLGPPPH